MKLLVRSGPAASVCVRPRIRRACRMRVPKRLSQGGVVAVRCCCMRNADFVPYPVRPSTIRQKCIIIELFGLIQKLSVSRLETNRSNRELLWVFENAQRAPRIDFSPNCNTLDERRATLLADACRICQMVAANAPLNSFLIDAQRVMTRVGPCDG